MIWSNLFVFVAWKHEMFHSKEEMFKNSFFFFLYISGFISVRHFLYDALALVFHAVVINTTCQMLGIEFQGMRTGSGWDVLAMEYLSRNRC